MHRCSPKFCFWTLPIQNCSRELKVKQEWRLTLCLQRLESAVCMWECDTFFSPFQYTAGRQVQDR